jgi:photosystem II stability/assembly factor-like uncharacterized protein
MKNLINQLFVAFTFCFLLTGIPSQAQWSWAHPLPQGNALTTSSFPNDSIGWIAGRNGAVIKTTDYGATFTNQFAITSNDIDGISAGSSSKVYIISNNILYKSTNGGNTWNIHYRFTGNIVNDICFINPDSGWAVQNNAVIFTGDGGITWNTQNSLAPIMHLKVKATDAGLVYAITQSGNIVKSTDFGQNWNLYNTGILGTYTDVDFTSINKGFASGSFGLIQTTDGGVTWTNISNLPAAASGTLLHSVDFKTALIGYACGEFGNIVSTTDGGANWNIYTSTTQAELFEVVALGTSKAICGGNFGELYSTNNSGTSFSDIQQRYTTESLNAITTPNSLDLFAAGNQGTIIKSSNAGSSWTALTSTTTETLNDIQFINANIGVCVGNTGTLLRTTNGGTNWSLISVGLSDDLLGVCKTPSNKLYVVGGNDAILESTSNGNTWNAVVTPYTGFGLRFIGVQYTSVDTGYYLSNTAEMIATDDGGTNWRFITTGVFGNLTSMFFINGTTGWIGSSTGEILFTNDGGVNWNNQTPLGFIGVINKISFTDSQNGWAFTDRGILRTSDGGLSWTFEISPYPELKDALFFSGISALAVGSGYGTILQRSNDLRLSISIDTLCTEKSYNVSVTTTGTFNPGNTFQVQLSDDLGSFDFPIILGSINATGTTTILANILGGLTESSNYRLRLFASNPAMYSPVRSTPTTIKTSPDAFIVATGPTAFCLGDSLLLFALGSPVGSYQWFQNGIAINGANADSLWVFLTGDYTVLVDDGVCDYTSPILDVLVSNCSGIAENQKSSIRVSPNPTNGLGILTWNNDFDFKTFEITDATGKLISTEILPGNNQHNFDLSSYENGLYFIRLIGTSSSTIRIIKL